MLISEEYRKMQAILHENPHYGVASMQFAEIVARAMRENGITEVLDYGAGKQRLKEGLDALGVQYTYHAYEPSNPEFAGEPEPAQMVVCIDVLEHIEPDLLDNVLEHLFSKAKEYVLLTVHTGPAGKTLPDGRNAHLIQQPPKWWIPKFAARCTIFKYIEYPDGFLVMGEK